MGGYAWLKNERANRPDRVWVPNTFYSKLTHDQHQELATNLRERLSNDAILSKISTDLDLRNRGKFPTEEAAVNDLRARLICEVGEHNYAPSLNVGFTGVRRENAMLHELTERLMKDFQEITSPPSPYDNP